MLPPLLSLQNDVWETSPENSILQRFSNRKGTSFEDGIERVKDLVQLLVPNLPLCIGQTGLLICTCRRHSRCIAFAKSVYWWWNNTQIWLVLLTGWSRFSTNQKHYADLGSNMSSVWNFFAPSSDVISWGSSCGTMISWLFSQANKYDDLWNFHVNQTSHYWKLWQDYLSLYLHNLWTKSSDATI